MGGVAVIGERTRITDLAAGGAVPYPADTPDEVRRAWAELLLDTAVVVLTPAAAQALQAQLDVPPSPDRPLVVVMPP
ncbi:MAG TPA: V-type ATP synthase subunit F [Angustibacter sp.]|nr:V-type ATP synthase subunit F [Angustibacter sp.]